MSSHYTTSSSSAGSTNHRIASVLAAGPGKSNEAGVRVPLDVRAGDTILFGKYSGQEIKVDGTDYLIMKEDDVLAIAEVGLAATGDQATGRAHA
jgi:co-chaperonin GroES (HSP10)